MLQLLVYAGMQIPVGLLVDRYGPRSVMLTGAIVLTLAQAGFALAESYGAALVARVFVGMGDAMTWICLLRLVTSWFTGRRIPFVTALSGTLGQLGAIVAAAPMTWALGHLGLDQGLPDRRRGQRRRGRRSGGRRPRRPRGPAPPGAAAHLRHDPGKPRGPRWAHPGTRLGFWMHFVTQFSAVAMTLLWGFPFFVRGEGLHRGPGRPAAQPRGRRRDVQRTDDRLAHRPAPVAPLDHGADHRVVDRRRLDGGARLAGRRAVLAPRRAHPGHRDRRAGVDDRLRPGPHVESRGAAAPARTGSSTRPASRPAWSSSSRSA